MLKPRKPEFGIVTTSIESVECECGWGGTFLLPEENTQMIVRIIQHLKEAHELTIPNMIVQRH